MRRYAQWAGPALIALGLAGTVALSLQSPDQRSTFGWWLLSNARAYERVLPLVGLGAVLALVSLPQRIAALALFGSGVALGFYFADTFIAAVAEIPGAITHHFLTGPISSIAVGLCLAIPGRIRAWILPVAATIAGAMFAIAVRLTDPSFHNHAIAEGGVAVAFWLLAAVCLTLWAFRQSWFETAGRILGSWLIAIGLLYGGASLVPPRRPVSPPQLPSPSLSPDGLTPPKPDGMFPELDPSGRRQLPGGFDPWRQP